MVSTGTATMKMKVRIDRVERKSELPGGQRFAMVNTRPANSRNSPRKMYPVIPWK